MHDANEDFERVRAAVKIATAELDMLRCMGPDANPISQGVRGKTLKKVWKYLGEVFAAGIEEDENV